MTSGLLKRCSIARYDYREPGVTTARRRRCSSPLLVDKLVDYRREFIWA